MGGSGGLGHAVVGVGRLQRVLLPTSLASRLDERYLKGSSGRIGEDDRTGDERGAGREDNQPSLGLNYGRRCLQNALFLMSQVCVGNFWMNVWVLCFCVWHGCAWS